MLPSPSSAKRRLQPVGVTGVVKGIVMSLTLKQVAKLVEPDRHFDEHGLHLQVIGATNRSWLFRYRRRVMISPVTNRENFTSSI
jgi:hypothetical protein